MFKVGNRVEVTMAHNLPLGIKGKIIAKRSGYNCNNGVEFDCPVRNGHSLDGVGEYGHCLWLGNNQLSGLLSNKQERDSKMLNKLSTFAKKHLDKDVRSFVQLGWMSEGLEVTSRGEEAIVAYLFDVNKSELGKIARADIKELKSKK